MGTRNLSRFLFILLFTGIVTWAQAQALAQINLGDGICSTEEKNLNLCIEAYEYVIEVLPQNGQWPYTITTPEGNTYKAFRYRASAPLGCKSPTWSYTVTQLPICEGANSVDYVLGSIPDGSSLIVPTCTVSKCADISDPPTCGSSYEVWKLNPTLSCSTGGSIDFILYTGLDTGMSCGNKTYVRTAKDCEGGLLRGPGCSQLGSIETTRVFDGGSVTINYDICSGDVSTVTFPSAVTVKGKAWILVEGEYHRCFNAGPRSSGCIVNGSTYYLNGGDAYVPRGR